MSGAARAAAELCSSLRREKFRDRDMEGSRVSRT
jgi:hypothetical protein